MSIYLDYNASTPLDSAVAAAMRPFLDEAFGNPSSGHWASTPAKAALENARVRRGVRLEPLIHGASHEGGRRAGTESVLLAAGLGAACALADNLAPMTRIQALRDRLWQGLQGRLGERVALNGHPEHRLPSTLNA